MANTTSTRRATTIASLALILWAFEPLVVSELESFPIFQSLTLVFGCCFIQTAIRITLKRKWGDILKQPAFVWCFGVLAICGSDFAYMLGAYTAPVAHVDLIDYLWPFMVIIFVGFLPHEKLSTQHILGAVFGFIGIAYMVTGGQGSGGFNFDYLPGYMLALYGVTIWGLYSAYSKNNLDIPSDMVGIYCGIGALVTCFLHFYLEETIMPTFSQGGLALTLGLAGPGLAYQLWDHGMKYGDANFLSVACYMARVAAMALLVYFGKEPMSSHLIIACGLSIFGVVISGLNDRTFNRCIKLLLLPYHKLKATISPSPVLVKDL